MRNHIGQIITKYNMAAIASKAYLKAATPINIQSAFKKTGIFPYCSEVIPQAELYAAESFREENPIKKVKEMKEGKEEVSKFIEMKVEKCMLRDSKSDENNNNEANEENVQTEATAIKPNRPQPGGKAITEGDFHDQLVQYESTKPKTVKSKINKRKEASSSDSQKPSGSGCSKSKFAKKQNVPSVQDDDSDEDIEVDDSEKCCVCKLFSPPDLSKCAFIKIVSWGQCDQCSHWVHLSFCSKVKALRRDSDFLCPCCE